MNISYSSKYGKMIHTPPRSRIHFSMRLHHIMSAKCGTTIYTYIHTYIHTHVDNSHQTLQQMFACTHISSEATCPHSRLSCSSSALSSKHMGHLWHSHAAISPRSEDVLGGGLSQMRQLLPLTGCVLRFLKIWLRADSSVASMSAPRASSSEFD